MSIEIIFEKLLGPTLYNEKNKLNLRVISNGSKFIDGRPVYDKERKTPELAIVTIEFLEKERFLDSNNQEKIVRRTLYMDLQYAITSDLFRLRVSVQYSCPHCGERFTKVNFLKVKEQKKPYQCVKCKKEIVVTGSGTIESDVIRNDVLKFKMMNSFMENIKLYKFDIKAEDIHDVRPTPPQEITLEMKQKIVEEVLKFFSGQRGTKGNNPIIKDEEPAV